MRIAVAGGGYVGLATATGFAKQGHNVHIFETDAERADLLRRGRIPFLDKSLLGPFGQLILSGKIAVHDGYPEVAGQFGFAFICVPTPQGEEGYLDSSSVLEAARSLEAVSSGPLTIVIRSTVNPGTTRGIEGELASSRSTFLTNPEFLREGTALEDFEHPSRIVIGGSDDAAIASLAELYRFTGAPILCMDTASAETVKLASNAGLALRVSMTNEVSRIAQGVGANIDAVLQGLGMDPRIGSDYLRPGIGFGGTCLPKDLQALRAAARRAGVASPVFDAADEANRLGLWSLQDAVLEALQASESDRVCIVGLAFKPGSDSVRHSLSVDLALGLVADRIDVTVFDPVAIPAARSSLGAALRYADTFAEAVAGAAVIVLIDPSLADASVNLDGRMVLDALGQQLGTKRVPAPEARAHAMAAAPSPNGRKHW
jgi:UDPglucose 6-dehydrogenase